MREAAAELAALQAELESARVAHDVAEEKRLRLTLAWREDKLRWQTELEQGELEARKLQDELVAVGDLESLQTRVDALSGSVEDLTEQQAAETKAALSDAIAHREAIVADSARAIADFTAGVDAAAVLVNASTRFTDGGEFGFGAEIGISTQKLHARGPMGLPELTCGKWLVVGQGHVRA